MRMELKNSNNGRFFYDHLATSTFLEAAVACSQALSMTRMEEEDRLFLLSKIFEGFKESFMDRGSKRPLEKEQGSVVENQAFEGVSHPRYVHAKTRSPVEDGCQEKVIFSFIEKAMNQGAIQLKNMDAVLQCVQEAGMENKVKLHDLQDAKQCEIALAESPNMMDGKGSSKEEERVLGPTGNILVDINRYAVSKGTVAPRQGETCLSFGSPCKEGEMVHAVDPKVRDSHVPLQGTTKIFSGKDVLGAADLKEKVDDFSGKLADKYGHSTSHVNQGKPSAPSFADVLSKGTTHVPLLKNISDFLEVAKLSALVPFAHGSHNSFSNEENGPSVKTTAHSVNDSPRFKVDHDVLSKRMDMLKFSIIGRISLSKGDKPWLLTRLREKLKDVWGFKSSWRLISLGKGYFHIVLSSQEELDKVRSRGPIFLNPGVLRLQRWSLKFDPLKEKCSTAQVWFRIMHLPWSLWDTSVITGIARKIGFPLRIDKATLEGDFGHYARVLIEVDLSKHIKNNVHVECNNHMFEVELVPENIPLFCHGCNSIGHSANECRIFKQKILEPRTSKGKSEGEKEDLTAALVNNVSLAGANSSRFSKEKVKVIGKDCKINGTPVVLSPKAKVIVETITDFSAHVDDHPFKDPIADCLITTNTFSVLGTNEGFEEGDSCNPEELSSSDLKKKTILVANDEMEKETPIQLGAHEVDFLPTMPRKWSDILDEVDDEHLHVVSAAMVERPLHPQSYIQDEKEYPDLGYPKSSSPSNSFGRQWTLACKKKNKHKIGSYRQPIRSISCSK